MQALQRSQFTDIRNLESFDLQWTGPFTSMEEARTIARQIAEVEGVSAAFVYTDLPVIVQSEEGKTISLRLRGIDAPPRFLEHTRLFKGELFTEGTIASSYTNYGWIKEGRQAKLTFLRRGKQATIVPSTKNVEVGGIFYTNSWEFDRATLLASLETVHAISADTAFSIGLYSDLPIQQAKRVLSKAGYRDIQSYQEVNEALWSAMELEQKMMGLMLAVMVVIVLVHAYSSTRRLVAAKQREIAMLMTMGATRRLVLATFIGQAAVIAVVGLGLGVGLCWGALALYPHYAPLLYRRLGTSLVLQIRVWEVVGLSVGIFAFSLISATFALKRLLGSDIMEMFVYDEVN